MNCLHRLRARRRLLAGLSGLGVAVAMPARAALLPSDPLARPALVARRAPHALLLDIVAAGTRLVAVGERGIVLLSDDAGQRWRQAAVPVAVTLTRLVFIDGKQGWAVGHGGVVLHSNDGGEHWRVQTDGRGLAQTELDAARRSGDATRLKRAEQRAAEGADKPLLGLHFDADGRRGVVHGAYGLLFGTSDGGATWQSWLDRTDNPRGLHLNALHVAGDTLYLAGEQGLLLRSTDAGRTFARLRSPYDGSWFALTGFADGRIVAGGLKGNVWCSDDGGASFQRSAVPVPVSIAAALRPRDGQCWLINQAGMLLASSDRGASFQALPLPPGPPLTGALLQDDGSLVASTMRGPLRLPRPLAAAAR